ncbi:MFS general substrate transporter [Trametes meyenii]|nr:MFS general substrate transporter [Trametes meyenii]
MTTPPDLVAVSAIEKAGEVIHHIGDEDVSPPTLTAEEERLLWRKIDFRLLPILVIMYLVASLDRSNIGNGKLQGLVTQLELTGTKYNIALALCFTQTMVKCSLVIKKLRPSRWLPGITVSFSSSTSILGRSANDSTYHQLVGVRVLLGIAEAGLPPGVFYYITMWYPRHMVQYRVGLFWGGATFAGAFSGLLAFGISFMSGTAGLLGWSWIFIIEGLVTIVVAVISFFVLVDFPDTASFLTPQERAYVVHLKSMCLLPRRPPDYETQWLAEYDNSSVGEEEHFEVRQIWETLLDWKVILGSLINMSVITTVYGITLFLPFGFNTVVSQLLSVPPYVVATIAVVTWGKWSDNIKMRSPSILAGLLCCLTGFAINAANVSAGVKYFGTFLIVTGGYAGFPGNVSWMGNNIVGHYRRAIAIGTQVMFANAGGAIACNIYRVEDAPRYLLGHAVEIGFVCMGLTLLPIVVATFIRINAKRDARQRDMEERDEELRRMGNQAPGFRYAI